VTVGGDRRHEEELSGGDDVDVSFHPANVAYFLGTR
jgi:hypothetical protein